MIPPPAAQPASKPERQEVFTVDESARFLRVSPRMVRGLLGKEQLRSFHVGRRVLVSRKALVAFIREREAGEVVR